MSKNTLKSVTLACADTTAKVHNSVRALNRSLEQCEFGDVKLFTNDKSLPYAVEIPRMDGMEAYSNFCIRDLVEYIETEHVLLIQYDGYVLNGSAWNPDFLNYDYIGAPWGGVNLVGNGGFSLRSRKLLAAASTMSGNAHPEDNYLCRLHRQELMDQGMRFCPTPLAHRFAVEGASFVWSDYAWNSDGRHWQGQFGFHSYLTPLPGISDRPNVFHHSGDLGDIIYSLATVKALGGGVLYLSPDNKFPFPGRTRLKLDHPMANLYTPFIEFQDYIWQCKYTPTTPFSTDRDLNKFRLAYQFKSPDNFASLYHLHAKPFGVILDESPWLKVDRKMTAVGRPILINCTARYQNGHFPWQRLVRKYGGQMVFVGIEEDYVQFRNRIGLPCPPWVPTANIMELARLIAGAGVLIGNQSAPMAIALGLGQNVIQECWQGNPNCLFPKRRNAIFWGVDTTDPNIDIPPAWLNSVGSL